MRLDKFTSKFQEAIADAQSLALGRDQQFIEPVHIMFALLNQEGGTVRELLNKLAINFNELRSKVSQAIERLPRVEVMPVACSCLLQQLNCCSSAISWHKSVKISLFPVSYLCWRLPKISLN